MGNCTSAKASDKGNQGVTPKGHPIRQPITPRGQPNTPLESKEVERPINTARASGSEPVDGFSAAAAKKTEKPIREKTYNREERYHNYLAHIWTYVKTDDRTSLQNVFEQY